MEPGKVAVITGAGGGIGSALTKRFLELGCTVWGLDIAENSMTELKNKAGKYGQELFTRKTDVSNAADLQAASEEIIKKHGKIDYWINNAGVAYIQSFHKQPPEQFEKMVSVNFWGVVNGTRTARGHMETRGSGWIVNIASVAGHIPCTFMTGYAATKHAVVGFTRSLQTEMSLMNSSVKLLLVSPGFVDTPMIMKGEKLGFPEWLSFLVSPPEAVVTAVIQGIRKNRQEVVPTFSGKMMMGMSKVIPRGMQATSRILLTKNWKDIFWNRFTG